MAGLFGENTMKLASICPAKNSSVADYIQRPESNSDSLMLKGIQVDSGELSLFGSLVRR